MLEHNEYRPEERVYVVDSSGWGWFALGFVLILPFVYFSSGLKAYAEKFASNPLIFILIFFILSIILALFYRHRIGFITMLILLQPILVFQMLYVVPYIIMAEHVLDIIFEWFIVTGLTIAFTVFIAAMAQLIRSSFLRFIIVLIYFALALLLALLCSPPESMTMYTFF